MAEVILWVATGVVTSVAVAAVTALSALAIRVALCPEAHSQAERFVGWAVAIGWFLAFSLFVCPANR